MKFLISVFLCYVWCGSFINCLRIFDESLNYALTSKSPLNGVRSGRSIEENWTVQKIDNFNPNDNRTWNQRYQIHKDYFKQGGPVFLKIEATTSLIQNWFDGGAWCGDYAKEMNAICIQLEHRYFGMSQPFEDLSVENLSYLTSQQALADIAAFISSFTDDNKSMIPAAKWVIFGENYGGNLAAWARTKYPNLIHAAVSTSSPLLAKMDYREYFMSIEKTLGSESAECVLKIRQGYQMLNKLIETDKGIKVFQNLFGLCPDDIFDPKNKNDVSTMFHFLAASFSAVAEIDDGKNYLETVETNNMPLESVKNSVTMTKSVCNIMVDESIGDPLSRLIEVYRRVRNLEKNGSCIKLKYKLIIDHLKKTNNDMRSTDRQMVYLHCNELGHFPTSNQPTEVFSHQFPVEYFVGICADVFGSKFTKASISKAVEETNKMYGGLDINGERIIYVYGSLDPNSELGITETKINDSVAIVVGGIVNAQSAYISNPVNDPPELTKAHETIKSHLKKLLDSK